MNAQGFEIGDTVRTKCGNGRASYHPEWSETQPWVTYIRGTAGRHFASLDEVRTYFRNSHNMTLVV